MSDWHIAQINVATAVYPFEDPRIAEFVAALDDVNALAERSPGFVWRLKSDSGNATDIRVSDNPKFIVNLTVWESIEALFDFVYKSSHRLVMVRRREWFEKPVRAYQAMWWIASGTVPSVEDALARLAHLDAQGPSAHAFTFKQKFPPPGIGGEATDLNPDPYCVGWR